MNAIESPVGVSRGKTLKTDGYGHGYWGPEAAPGSESEANANIAPLEEGPTASQAYAVGNLMIYQGQLMTVVQAIAEGGAITPGTNVMSYTVAQALMSKVPVYGMGKNLLRNAYFVGGGSQQGGGQFPINQRAGYVAPADIQWYVLSDTSFTNPIGNVGYIAKVLRVSGAVAYCAITGGTTEAFIVKAAECIPGYTGAGYGIDGWKITGSGTVTIFADGMELAPGTIFDQIADRSYSPGPHTISVLYADGSLDSITLVVSSGAVSAWYPSGKANVQIDGTLFRLYIGATAQRVVVIKLELGPVQTLAHLENGVWVLNEVPDYEEELVRCQTSKADASDSYANRDVFTGAAGVMEPTAYKFNIITLTRTSDEQIQKPWLIIKEKWPTMPIGYIIATTSIGGVYLIYGIKVTDLYGIFWVDNYYENEPPCRIIVNNGRVRYATYSMGSYTTA